MSRDRLKFRMWCEKSNHYIDPYENILAGIVEAESETVARLVEEEGETIEFCTGFRDYRGRLIFEGDIIEGARWHGPALVHWSDLGRWRMEGPHFICTGIDQGFLDEARSEVVGNIHESACLLQQRVY